MNHTVVEATSLSHVTDVATNPPLHPSAPLQIPWLPLVLYFARVPGSRDVFLTPLKPREKVVSAEDVRSSLYYVHVNLPEDFVPPPRELSSVNADAEELVRATPLPPRHSNQERFNNTPEYALSQRPPLPKRPLPPLTQPFPVYEDARDGVQRRSPSPQKVGRKPVPSAASNATPMSLVQHSVPLLPRRPLPNPPHNDDANGEPSLHDENVRILRHSEHLEMPNPYHQQFIPLSVAVPVDAPDMPEPGTLTLIRRDPSSNAQWNVASIHDPSILEVSSAALLNANAARRTKKGGAPLYLDVTNPSYAQYIGTDRTDLHTSTTTIDSADISPPPPGVFRRRLFMPGSRHAEHGYRMSHKFSSMESSEDAPMRKSMRHSVDFGSLSSSPAVTDRRSKGYTFASPWDGQCEFTTGATGKSLKCKHHLPILQGGRMIELSELRFNLPTKSLTTQTSLADKRSTYFSGMHRRFQSNDSGDGSMTPTFRVDEDGKLDLSLGQEKAGGGFGGKQAKLGKLIIEPEGMKMLDLLVAANVGLWWRAYERA